MNTIRYINHNKVDYYGCVYHLINRLIQSTSLSMYVDETEYLFIQKMQAGWAISFENIAKLRATTRSAIHRRSPEEIFTYPARRSALYALACSL